MNDGEKIITALLKKLWRAETWREVFFLIGAIWSASQYPLRVLVAILFVSVAVKAEPACTTIDPGGCRPHADETPFGDDKPQLHIQPVARYELTATAVLTDSCTICGKKP